ncbi:Carbohydrate-binding WSC [Fusarium oxysporum f. sp. vasinfectum]|nr:Carbohydrate-binding WSC [Fusarium oxysporum f. sp. vasinfectum]
MRLQLSSIQVVASAVLLPVSQAFSIVTTNDANALASAIFGQGITILQASFSGATVSSGTFDDGPFGIGSGGILTSGAAVGALPNGDHYVNNGAPGSDTYCNANTFNAAILTVDFFLNPTYSGVRVELILASEEEGGSSDPIGIFVGGTQYALDPNGNKITATSPYLAQPIGITPPDSVTSYPGSSPPFWIDILTSGAQTMVIAICDQGDSEWDSALLINAEGCIDCDTDVRLAYVTTTTTLPPGEATFTSTTKASGTVSGTIRIGVTADETTTTTAEPTTNTTQDFTTTTEEPTATTQETTPTETSTEASSTFTSSEELPDTTTTTLVTSDATKDSSTIAIEATSEIITTTSLDPSTQSTTGAETISTTDTETISTTDTETISTTDTETISTTDTETIRTSDAPIDGTTTSSGYVKTPITSSAVSASTDEPTESLSSDISTQDTAVPKPDITTTAESPEDTTVQQTEPSTDVNPPSSPGSAERTSSSNTITSTAGGIPTPATSTVAASSIMPANLPVIGTFRFFGCLGSPAGYPSFELIGEGPDMTTEECVRIGTGYAYIGIYLRSCYAADTLDFADTVATGRCDILCPGDPGLFCGGVVETSFKFHRGLSHREAPPGILLTLYAQIEAISSSLTTSDVLSAVDVKTDNSLLPTGNPTIPISLSSSTRSLVDSTITVEPSVTIIQSQGRRPIIPPFPTTISFNAGNFTRTEAVVITTITYTVVDPNNPSYLTVTELCTTLRSPPCSHCQYQQPQTVEMTTIKVDCNACGHYGENTIILEVPAGAAVVAPTGGHSVHETHQTHQVQYHEPNPYRQKPHPDESDPHIWQKPRPQNTSPATGNELHEGEGGHKFVQAQTYQGGPTGTRSSHGQGEPAVVTKTEPKPTPVGWNRQPEPPKPTFYRRPGPASTPVALDAPIVVVSGAVAKTMEGMFMAISFMTVFVFFL